MILSATRQARDKYENDYVLKHGYVSAGGNLAGLVDAVDCDYIYFDGIEGLSIWGTDTETRLHRAFWNPVKRTS
jgi:hypothetical protein